MASAYSPLWRRFLHKVAPFLFYRCPGYNYHWRWERYCWCVVNENGQGVKMRIDGGAWIDLGPNPTLGPK